MLIPLSESSVNTQTRFESLLKNPRDGCHACVLMMESAALINAQGPRPCRYILVVSTNRQHASLLTAHGGRSLLIEVDIDW